MDLSNLQNNNDNTIAVSESNFSISKNNDTNKRYIEDKKQQLFFIEQYEKELDLQAKQNQMKAKEDILRQQKEYEEKEKHDRRNAQKNYYLNFVNYKEYNTLNNKINDIFHNYSQGNFDKMINISPIFDNDWIFPKNPDNNNFGHKLTYLQRVAKREEIKNKANFKQNNYKHIRGSKSENKYIRTSTNTPKNILKKSTNFIKDNKLKRSNTTFTQRNNKNKNNDKSFNIYKSAAKKINNNTKRQKTMTTDKRSKTAKNFYKKNRIDDINKQNFNKQEKINNCLMDILSDRKQQTEYNVNYDEISRTDFRKYIGRDIYLSSNNLSNNKTTCMTTDRFFSNKKNYMFEDKKREELYNNAFRRCNYKKSFKGDNYLTNPKTTPKIIKTERNFFHHQF